MQICSGRWNQTGLKHARNVSDSGTRCDRREREEEQSKSRAPYARHHTECTRIIHSRVHPSLIALHRIAPPQPGAVRRGVVVVVVRTVRLCAPPMRFA
jgi:hypothetical protein